MNKRGLKNIIVTTLLILLASAGIITLYSPIKQIAERAGISTALQQECILTDVRVISCEDTPNEVILNVRVARGEAESIIGLVEFEDGSLAASSINAPGLFATREIRIAKSPNQIAKIGKASAVVSDDEGNAQTCTESPFAAPCSLDSGGIQPSRGFSDIAFALELSDGTFREYSTPTSTTANTKSYSDMYVAASIENLGNNQFKLTISNKDTRINSVWFPYETSEILLNSDPADDIIYYPSIMGAALKQPPRTAPGISPQAPWLDYANGNICYPGKCFSPIIILGDSTNARGMASLNWPPKPATPKYKYEKIALKNNVEIQPRESGTFTALYSAVNGDSTAGNAPWYAIADEYKLWLKQNMAAENLYPINYPPWMKNIEGFIAIGLQDIPSSDLNQVQTKWSTWKDKLPWIVIWGQMSDWSGPDRIAIPGTGCCLLQRIIHSRYLPPNSFDLISFANSIIAENKHIAYYQRPMRPTEVSPYSLLDNPEIITTPENTQETALQWLQEWIRKNEQEFGSNSFYIDVLGAVYLGDPLFVAKLFVPGTQDYTIKPESFIEHPVDIYPTTYLIGGTFSPVSSTSGPGKTLDNSQTLSFPQFGRYILDDRIFFGGSANGDWYFWGNRNWPETHRTGNRGFLWPSHRDYCLQNPQDCEYWTERQVFLLGAKFDARMVEDHPNTPTTINKVLGLVIDERARANWWAREPKYLDKKGISNIPNNVEIRRFIFVENQIEKNLFVVDNWDELQTVQFTFEGQDITINIQTNPATNNPYQIYIYELPVP